MALTAECPVCREPLRWTYVLRPLWSQWRCGRCGSLLGVNRRRRLLAILPFIVLLLSASVFLSRAGWGDFAVIPVVLVLWIPYFLLLDRASVLERCGFRCKRCGYDLRGQVVPRCPECGREFDAEEKARFDAGLFADATPTAPPRRRLALTLLIIVPLLLTVGLGIAHWRSYSVRLARQRAVATQPVAPAGGPVSASRPSS